MSRALSAAALMRTRADLGEMLVGFGTFLLRWRIFNASSDYQLVGFAPWSCYSEVSNVEVTVRYHLMTHTLFFAIVCLTIYFYYLLPTEWQYRPGGD